MPHMLVVDGIPMRPLGEDYTPIPALSLDVIDATALDIPLLDKIAARQPDHAMAMECFVGSRGEVGRQVEARARLIGFLRSMEKVAAMIPHPPYWNCLNEVRVLDGKLTALAIESNGHLSLIEGTVGKLRRNTIKLEAYTPVRSPGKRTAALKFVEQHKLPTKALASLNAAPEERWMSMLPELRKIHGWS